MGKNSLPFTHKESLILVRGLLPEINVEASESYIKQIATLAAVYIRLTKPLSPHMQVICHSKYTQHHLAFPQIQY